MSDKKLDTPHKYPNAFAFGAVSGFFFQWLLRRCTLEPFTARPFNYVTSVIIGGCFCSYYDWWKRCALEEVLYS